jgi:hypothetical protein
MSNTRGALGEPSAHAVVAKRSALIGPHGDVRKIPVPVYDREVGRFETTLPKVNYGIPCSRHHPKILRIDDTEIIGDRIAEFGPVAGHFFAQEIERRIGELGAGFVGFVG